MPRPVEAIVKGYLARAGCSQRLLAGDGITVPDFTIKSIPGILQGVSVDVKTAKQVVPAIGGVMSFAKNLDEYENRICKLVNTLPDSDNKLLLQKYRISILVSLAKLNELILERKYQDLAQWSRFAGFLLEEASEAFLKVSSGSNAKPSTSRISDSLAFFETSEELIDRSLRTFYGLT